MNRLLEFRNKNQNKIANMKKLNNKNMFGAWMALIMIAVVSVFTSCEKLEENMGTKSSTTPASTRKVYSQNKEREITGPTTEECRFEKVVEENGKKSVTKKSVTLRREVKGIPEYQKSVSGFDYKHQKNNSIIVGTPEYKRTSDDFKINGRTDELGGVKVNGFDTDVITTSYSIYHEACTYDDGEIQVSFEFVEPTFTEKSTTVSGISSPVSGKDAARLNNTITTSYYKYDQDVSESVVLLMEKGVTIVDEGFVTNSCKETISDNSAKAYFLYRISKSDGSHEDFDIEVSDTREATVKGPWSSIESNNNQSTGSASKTEKGSTDKSTSKDGFTVNWKRYSYDVKAGVTLSGSTQTNLIETVEPEGWTASYRGKTYTIPRSTYNVSNDKGTVTGGSEKNGYNVYDYANKFTYTRASNTQNFTTKGEIKVKKEITITDEGFVTGSCKETISDGTAKAYFLYRITKSDGSHQDFDVEVSDTREATVKGPWSSIESNYSQSTGSASKTEKGSTDKSTTKNGFTVNWKRYSYNVKASVSLAGSTQTNLIETVEPEGWTASYRGKTYTISRSSYTVSNDNGSVANGGEKNGYNLYNYTNKFTYTRGTNTKNFTTKGEILIQKEEPTFFPPEWGTLEYARQTVANNESHNGYAYTLSLRFSAGYTLPVVIRAGSTIPEWHFEYVEKTDVTDYNGGTYDKASNTWINTKAMDKPNQMVWSRYSKEKANQDYIIAKNLGWDEGHLVDGHASTQTSRYQITVSNGRLTVKDTYTGNNLGSWK
jgi:hypothetical protein